MVTRSGGKASSREDPRRIRSRRRILDTATSLVLKGGVGALTLEAVTTDSGVARTTLYRHFPSMRALIAATFLEMLPQIPYVSDRGSLHEELVVLIRTAQEVLIAARVQHSLFTWLALAEAESGTEYGLGELRRSVIAHHVAPLKNVLDRAVEREEIDGYDVEVAVGHLVGPLIVARLIEGRRYSPEEIDGFVNGYVATLPTCSTPSVEGE